MALFHGLVEYVFRVSPVVLALIAWSGYLACLGTYRILWQSSLAQSLQVGSLSYVFITESRKVKRNEENAKIAPTALTTWYQAYYDIWLRGQYVWRIKEMHAQYGPIIRINPNEIHINDPEFIDEVYAGPGKIRDKCKFTGRQMSQTSSMIVTMPHELHRKRRAAVGTYFSKANVRRQEPMIHESLAKLLGRFEAARKSGEILRLFIVFKAATSDIITRYAFGSSTDFLDQEDFNAPFYETIQTVFECVPWFYHIGWLGPLMNSLPIDVVLKLMPGIGSLHLLRLQWKGQIEDIMRSKDSETRSDTIFHGLLNSNLPASEKSVDRLQQEAQLIVTAGQDTTGPLLASIAYELLSNPSIVRKLKVELAKAIPESESLPTCAQVENLPYLSAVIQEGLRLHPPASMRGQRVSPAESVHYRSRDGDIQLSIPAGTPMSMSPNLIQTDPNIFSSPHEYRPERWLENPNLDRYLLAFSRGTRMCLGINLAYQELYLVIAGVFRKYDLYDPKREGQGPSLALYDTVRERDVDMSADLALPVPALGSKGVRIQVR